MGDIFKERASSFGEALAVKRMKRGLKQRDLARLVDATQQAVAHWENGRNKPSYETLLKLCAVLHVSIDELFANELAQEEKEMEKRYYGITKKLETDCSADKKNGFGYSDASIHTSMAPERTGDVGIPD